MIDISPQKRRKYTYVMNADDKVVETSSKMQNEKRGYNWPAIFYLLLVPTLAITLLPMALEQGVFTKAFIIYFLIHFSIDSLCITVGYHRLISHRAYEAHPVVKALILFFGAGAFQNSAMIWSMDHRVHHREVDTDDDPYSINKGFFYAHFLWMFEKPKKYTESQIPPDLRKDKMIRFQDRYYIPLAILVAVGLPVLFGWIMGSVFAGFYVGAALRLLCSGHCTFLINSAAHVIGTRPFSIHCTARDNWFLSILTFGEGYHNYHHRFQADYRNGLAWYAWDPSKWIIYGLSKVGLTSKLNRMAAEKVRLARMEVAELRLETKGLDVCALVKERTELTQIFEKMIALRAEAERIRSEGKRKYGEAEAALLKAYRLKIVELRKSSNEAIKRWKTQRKIIKSIPRVMIAG